MVYTCPMHPEVERERPGMCPECGMDLVKAESKTKEHQDKHAGHSTRMFRVKFWRSLFLSIPVVLYSGLARDVLSISMPQFFGSDLLPALLGTIIFFDGGVVFLQSAWRELKAKMPGMMTLIALAISAAFLFSVFAVFAGKETLFWELATLITIMLLGHWLEMKAVQGAQGALKELSKLLPDTAEVERNGESVIIPLSELKEGDIVLVRPGGKVPADGLVVEGKSDVDESMISGESKPVGKRVGDALIAGSVNGDGSIKARVTGIGEHTFLAGVMRLVAEAQASKSKLQLLSDRAAFYLTIVAVLVGGGAFVAWLGIRGDVVFATEILVAVLVIACPHALGLAVPLVASISTTLAAKNGLLVKQRMALEAARNIDVVLFDKTGTLTKGEYGVDKIWSSKHDGGQTSVLSLAASVDARSEHFISKAIVAKAKESGVALKDAQDFQRIPGKGVRGVVEGAEVYVGGGAILEYANDTLSFALTKEIDEEGKKGKTIIYVIRSGEIAGALALADVIREESKEAVARLRNMGVKTAMVTGDANDVAEWVSKEVGIDEYFARVLPQDKAEKVKVLQGRGLKVAMVGDGINDAPALTQADLGIAIGAGTNVAIESAGIILVKNDPRDIAKVFTLSRMTYSKMIQNLLWATGYNVVAIPAAAGALMPWGIILQPAFAALLMSVSTIVVAFNAMIMARKKL
ncbi:MAG: heavy metal translocating P-type ATPase [Candidatus Wildermuthbacteria bacterium]|nr:heavy metal translocating P-type ATPase [Candidatus Wildermuthbacteria bacterium]